MSVASITLQQLGGRNRLQAMIGAKNFVGGENYLQFDIRPGAKNKANKIQIVLNPNDTYTIIAYRFNKKELDCPEVGKIDNVYVDNLHSSFTSLTGLYLSL